MRNTDQDWAVIAENAPYWGVLSVDEYRGTTLTPDLSKKFFDSGEALIDSVFTDIGVLSPAFSPRRSLDFGCGVARVLIPIARRSAQAVGLDIAPKMLELATSHIRQAGLNNVTLLQSDDDLSQLGGTFDFIHSFIVLQHIPPQRGYQFVRRLLDRLEIDGAFALHFSFAKQRDLMVHEMPMAKYYRREGNVIRDLVATHEHPPGTVSMFDYDLNEVLALLNEFVTRPLLLRLTPGTHLGLYIIGQRGK